MPTYRILVVDDDPLFHTIVEQVVALDPHLTLVGHAATGREALHLVAQLQPDLVLMDILMPDLTGFEATARLKCHAPAPVVVLITSNGDDPAYRALAHALGADAFLSKLDLVTQAPALMHTLLHPAPGTGDDAQGG